MTTETSTTTETTIPFAPTRAAFNKHESFIRAIAPEHTREARVDLNAVSVRCITALPVLRLMRAQIVTKLPDLDLAVYDSIEERVYAAHYANTLWQAKLTAKENVPELAEVLEERYAEALGAYEVLILFKLASAEPKGRLETGGGYSALTNNLSRVLGVLRGVAPDVLSQTPLKPRDLEQIEHDLLMFQAAWGSREFTAPSRDEAGTLRAQAFTYLYDAYELARRAALYFHGYERGDELVPSLFASLGDRSKRSTKAGSTDTPTAAAGQTPSTGSSNGGQAAAAGQRSANGSTTDATSVPFVMDNAAKLPLTSPFEPTK
jgi:hypothetical protein